LDKPKKPVRTSLPIIQVWGTKATQCFSVIDQDYKYVYWFYKDESQGLKPSEELFDLKNDPYEMLNMVGDAKNKSQLNRMRELYDQQLQHWKAEGVKYNDYEKYGLLFDRNISWEEKEKVIIKGKKK